MQAPRITEEIRQALAAQPGQPVRIRDDKTKKSYLLIEESVAGGLFDEWLRTELEKGFAAVQRGDVVDWDPQRIKDEGRRRLAEDPRAS